VLALVATIASSGFAVQLWLRQRARPRPATRAWLIGLVCYAVGVGCQALAELGVFGPLLYRFWYLTGAFMVAAFLGAGSLYLAAPPRLAGWAMRGVAWASILVAPAVLTAPIDLGRVDPRLLTGDGFPSYVRLLTPLFNAFGTLALVGVALWSAARLTRGGQRRRLLSVGLIALGAMVAASGSTLLRLGVPGGFYASQLVGVALMWLGFGLAH
jgi:hypothetical protein